MRLLPLLLGLLLLSACGTPLEQCLARASSDLRQLESERAERQRNLDRGYALERRILPVISPRFCPHPVTGAPIPCPSAFDRWETEPVPINRRIEVRRIELLDRLIAEERIRAATAQAACRQQFPVN